MKEQLGPAAIYHSLLQFIAVTSSLLQRELISAVLAWARPWYFSYKNINYFGNFFYWVAETPTQVFSRMELILCLWILSCPWKLKKKKSISKSTWSRKVSSIQHAKLDFMWEKEIKRGEGKGRGEGRKRGKWHYTYAFTHRMKK